MTFTDLDLSAAIFPTDDPYGQLDGDGNIVTRRGYPEVRLPDMPSLDPDTFYKIQVDYTPVDEDANDAPRFWLYSQKTGDVETAYATSLWWRLSTIDHAGVYTMTVVIGPGIVYFDNAMASGETEILFVTDRDFVATAIRWDVTDEPDPVPDPETLQPGEGADNWQNAQPLEIGETSYPTSSVGKGVSDLYELGGDTFSADLTRTAWWYVDVPADWNTDDFFRFDTMQMVGNPDTYIQVFAGTPSSESRWSSADDDGGSGKKTDKDVSVEPGQRYYFRVGLKAFEADADYLLRVGILSESFAYSDLVTPDPITVRMWLHEAGVGGSLDWTHPIAADGGTETLNIGSENYWAVMGNAETGVDNSGATPVGAESMWDVFTLGHNGDWPLVVDNIEELVTKNQDGTGVNHGEDTAYPEGRWLYYSFNISDNVAPSSNLGGMGRREWGNVSIFGGELPAVETHAQGITLSQRYMFADEDPDLTDSGWTNRWRPSTSGLTPPPESGISPTPTYSAPGELLSAELAVAMKNQSGSSNEGDERVLIGVRRFADTGGNFTDLVEHTNLLAVLEPPAPSSADNDDQFVDTVVTRVPLPDGWSLEDNDEFVAIGSPSVYPAYTALPAEPGFSPDSFPAVWESRWGGLSKSAGDVSVDTWQMRLTLAVAVEYLYQPPTFRWQWVQRETVADVFIRPKLRQWQRGDLRGMQNKTRLGSARRGAGSIQ